MRNTGLASEIERDLLRDKEPPRHNIVACFMCGYMFVYRGSRFCSDRCRDFYDAGEPGHEQDWLKSKPNNYGITGWKVVAGPPGIEIGSDYYKLLRGAFGRRKVKAKAKRNKIPNYTVKANGHGYWQPSAVCRSLGFMSVDCGFDGEGARLKAQTLNAAASEARKRTVDAQNTNREGP